MPLPHTQESGKHNTISWWLAAGIVGADIGTSVFYSTGVLLPIVGFAAPFFILFIALMLWIFKMTYQEGCAVSPINGGAYSMVLQTIGRRAALVIGSLTILSYLATAVVSALSGAYYLSSLWSTSWAHWQIFAVAAIPIVGFAGLNLWGLKESAKIVFAISAFHFSMLLVMDIWGLWLAFTQGVDWSRLWQGIPELTPYALIFGFAVAFLGITGFESAAQIIEEIEKPTWKSIRKIYLTIVLLVFITSPITSMLCLLLLSDAQVTTYKHNLLSGLAYVQGGYPLLVLLVANACLTLFAAVNTAYAGATGLMTTMGKQGNLPVVVLNKWTHRFPFLKGYPFVSLSFMLVSLGMLAVFPGEVERLGAIYGMAFLGVMVSYSVGVVLMRWRQPAKVKRIAELTPNVSKWTIHFAGKPFPLPPIIGGGLLLIAEVTLIFIESEARDLGVQIFLAILLIMAFYRLGQVENRMVQLPDLRLGLGRINRQAVLPDNLPIYVLCISHAQPVRLVTLISYLLKRHTEQAPIEIVLFHAEEQDTPQGEISANLERLVSQQLEDFFAERDFILSVKVLPGNLDEVLPEYQKVRPFTKVYIGGYKAREESEALAQHLQNELAVQVEVIDEQKLPKGPAVWFSQWARRRPPRGGQRGTGPLREQTGPLEAFDD